MNIDLSSPVQYDIAAAMRGPDRASAELKYLTTAVVRYFAGVASNNGYVTVYAPAQAQFIWDNMEPFKQTRLREEMNENLHFTGHITDALAALSDLVPEQRAEIKSFNYWLAGIRNGAI